MQKNSRVFLMHFSKARSRDGAPGLPSPSTPTGKLHVQGDSVLQEVEKLAIVEDSPSQPQTSPHAPKQADPQVCTHVHMLHAHIHF